MKENYQSIICYALLKRTFLKSEVTPYTIICKVNDWLTLY